MSVSYHYQHTPWQEIPVLEFQLLQRVLQYLDVTFSALTLFLIWLTFFFKALKVLPFHKSLWLLFALFCYSFQLLQLHKLQYLWLFLLCNLQLSSFNWTLLHKSPQFQIYSKLTVLFSAFGFQVILFNVRLKVAKTPDNLNAL